MNFENLKKQNQIIQKLLSHFGYSDLENLELWVKENQEYFQAQIEEIGLIEKPVSKTKNQIQTQETTE